MDSSVTGEEEEHEILQEVLPLLDGLQTAVKAAMEAEEPLADACYRADAVDTIRELTAHFEWQAKTLNGPEHP